MNVTKTTILLGLLTGLFLGIGSIWGTGGLTVALVIAAVMNFVAFFFSDKIVLAMYRARKLTPGEDARLERIVHTLAASARIPVPPLYVIASDAPNAFATGRSPSHAAVAVTEGLLRLMNEEELTGVLAHEIAHVKNRDILISSIAATLAGAILWAADMARWGLMFGSSRDDEEGGGGFGALLMVILAPIAAILIQMAISRSREYLADESGARIAGTPTGLASALRRLESANRRAPLETSPQTAHMFIVNPLSGKSLLSLFSTHPPVEARVARLMDLARGKAN